MLWEQLAEAQKKETILRQELQMTQQTLSDCEKIIEKQKEHINKVETEKVRLLNFKTSKGHRLEELEQKVSFYEIYEKINVDKLIFTLTQQHNELKSLRNKSSNYEQEVQQIRKRNADELNKVYKKFQQEISVKIQAIQSFDRMREQIKNIDQRPDASSQVIWKEKCHELFKICLQLQEENQQLSERCKQMAEIAVDLAQNMNKYGGLSPAKVDETDTINLLRQQQNLDHQAKNLKILSQRRQMTRKSEIQLPHLTNCSQKQNTNIFSSKVFDTQQLFQKNFIKVDQANITSNEQNKIFDYGKISDPQKKTSGGRPHKRGKSLLEIKREIDQQDRDSMRRNIIIGKQFGKEEQKEGTQSRHGFSTTQSRGSRILGKAPEINKNVVYLQETFISTNSKPFNEKNFAFSNNSKIESQQFDYNYMKGLSPTQKKINFPQQQ